jgi:DNA replication and repair protein RecF
MLQLNRISLIQFKNYGKANFEFEQPVIAVTGKNGVGKTNLLDAIHYLSFTRSYFGASDQSNMQTGMQGFRVEGKFNLENTTHDIQVILRENGKKEVSCSGALYDKFSEHIGKFPVVMIAPDDIELINGSAEIRRRFIDTILCQTDHEYLHGLIRYNKILQQRNSYLKQAAVLKRRDDALLDTIDTQLTESGNIIFDKRKAFAPSFKECILQYYKEVAGISEAADFFYESQLASQAFEQLLSQSREKDYLLQRTQFGIHKDNLELLLDNQPFKNRGSQGQKKSLLFALKLAEASTLAQNKGFSPILLLDDVFEKLDAVRMENLLHCICNDIKSQIFLTDTHPERMQAIFSNLGKDIQNIHITN